MAKHLHLYCLTLVFLFACEKSQDIPENEAFTANYVLHKVEKEVPQIYTAAGLLPGHSHALTQQVPFTDDTLTTIRAITFYKKTLSEVIRKSSHGEKSYYYVKSLDNTMEFSPRYYGIYYTFNPGSPAVFTPTTDQAQVQAGLTMKADVQAAGMVLTKYVLAFKDKDRYLGKVDENYLDPANLEMLKPGDTLITMRYRIHLRKIK